MNEWMNEWMKNKISILCTHRLKNTVKTVILWYITIYSKITLSEYILKCNLFLWSKLNFQHHYSSLQSQTIPPEIILICWFAAQETFIYDLIIISVDHVWWSEQQLFETKFLHHNVNAFAVTLNHCFFFFYYRNWMKIYHHLQENINKEKNIEVRREDK